MTFRLPSYKAGLRVKEKTHPKLYWFDPGVVRAIKNQLGPVSLEEKGALFEGFIAQVLRANKSYRKLFSSWAYWASRSHEVDFLLFRDNCCVAIEAKCGTRFRPEDTESLDLISEDKNFKKGKINII